MNFSKRVFDLALLALGFPLWGPVVLAGALVLLVFNGWPVFYLSKRRVHRDRIIRLIKYRVMVRNADRIVNRATVKYNGTRFLNLPIDASVYTGVGRIVERCSLTELPQILHVLTGQMSLVGNRPLPANVIDALREEHADIQQRFDTPCGLTGPVQLVGRHLMSDRDRLAIEVAYCRMARENYSAAFDLFVLVNTVLICLHLRKRLTFEHVLGRIHAWHGEPLVSSRLKPTPADPL